MFVELRKLHYSVIRRAMDMNKTDILAGSAKSASAKYYTMWEYWTLQCNYGYS